MVKSLVPKVIVPSSLAGKAGILVYVIIAFRYAGKAIDGFGVFRCRELDFGAYTSGDANCG